MIKYLILLFNFIGFLLVDLFLSNVSVSINAPAEAAPGSSFTVELTISKTDLKSFARYQQDFPVGYTATQLNSYNGGFTFQDQKLKIIWLIVPPDSTFTVTYNVKVDPTAEGPLVLSGSFSYIDNNERKTMTIPSKTVIIRPQGAIANNTQNPDSINNKQTVNNTLNQNFPADQIFCYRQIVRDIDGITVHLLVSTGILSKDKFGKVQETIPSGYTATNIENKDAIFSFKDNHVKFLWMTLPAESQFQISYKLTATSPTSEMPDLSGSFSYVENEGTKIKTVENHDFLGNNMLANNQISDKQKSDKQIADKQLADKQLADKQKSDKQIADKQLADKQKSDKQIADKQKSDKQIADKQLADKQKSDKQLADKQKSDQQKLDKQLANKQKSDKQIADKQAIVVPETGVKYKVQIGAYKRYLNVSYFKRLQVSEPVSVELNNGLNKYLIGLHSEYKEARDHRVKIWQSTPIRDAFVSAYNNGNRITVQEALMVANQKWYQ